MSSVPLLFTGYGLGRLGRSAILMKKLESCCEFYILYKNKWAWRKLFRIIYLEVFTRTLRLVLGLTYQRKENWLHSVNGMWILRLNIMEFEMKYFSCLFYLQLPIAQSSYFPLFILSVIAVLYSIVCECTLHTVSILAECTVCWLSINLYEGIGSPIYSVLCCACIQSTLWYTVLFGILCMHGNRICTLYCIRI